MLPPLPPLLSASRLPRPAVISIAPPVPPTAVVSPAVTNTPPPFPVLPLPTTTSTLPPCPAVALPVARRNAPECPALAVPVFKTMSPLTPAAPAFGVRSVKFPLECGRLNPVRRSIEPPVIPAAVVLPALIAMTPPIPELPTPTEMFTKPPLPRLASPVSSRM